MSQKSKLTKEQLMKSLNRDYHFDFDLIFDMVTFQAKRDLELLIKIQNKDPEIMKYIGSQEG